MSSITPNFWNKTEGFSKTQFQNSLPEKKNEIQINQVTIKSKSGLDQIVIKGQGIHLIYDLIAEQLDKEYMDRSIRLVNKDIRIFVTNIHSEDPDALRPILDKIYHAVESLFPHFNQLKEKIDDSLVLYGNKKQLSYFGINKIAQPIANATIPAEKVTNSSDPDVINDSVCQVIVKTLSAIDFVKHPIVINQAETSPSDPPFNLDWLSQHFNFKVSDVKKADFFCWNMAFIVEFQAGKESVASHFFDILESEKCSPHKSGNCISLSKLKEKEILAAGLVKKTIDQPPERKAIPQWICKQRFGRLNSYNSQEVHWSIENKGAEVGKLCQFTYSLNTTFSFPGQYDGWGVYELNGQRESQTSFSCKFNIYLLEENKEICEQEFINSIKAKIPEIGIDKVKEKEVIRNSTLMTSLKYQIHNVDLKYFFTYFIEKGDIPLNEVVKYSTWRRDIEKEYRKNLL